MLQFWLTVVIPVIFGALAIAGSGVVRRYLLKDKALSALQFLIVAYSFITLMSGFGYVATWGFEMPPKLLPKFWIAVFGGAAANFVIQFLNTKAATLDKGEVS